MFGFIDPEIDCFKCVSQASVRLKLKFSFCPISLEAQTRSISIQLSEAGYELHFRGLTSLERRLRDNGTTHKLSNLDLRFLIRD